MWVSESAVKIHALSLLAMPVVTLLVCCVTRRRRPTSRQVVNAGAITGVTVLMLSVFSAHLCNNGNPGFQFLIPGACLWVVLAIAGTQWVRVSLAVCLIGLMAILAHQYVELVHSRQWIGNPRAFSAAVEASTESALGGAKNKIREAAAGETTVYSPGWVRDLPFGSFLGDENDDQKPHIFEIEKEWHTPFTRLSSNEQDNAGFLVSCRES